MDIVRPINRRQRRIVSAVDRREVRRSFDGCVSCGPNTGLNEYRGVVSSMGRMFDNADVVKAAHSAGNAPQMEIAAQLAGVVSAGLECTEPTNRIAALSAITNEKFAKEVNTIVGKLPKSINVNDRAGFALMIVLLPGVEEARRGIDSHRSDAVVKLDQGLRTVLGGLGNLGAVEPVCNDTIRRDADWIKEPCGIFNTQSNRDDKITLVKDAYWTATGHAPSNCAINYYTAMRWCSIETYVAKIKSSEASRIAGGGPAPEDTASRNIFTNAADFLSILEDKLIELITTATDKLIQIFCAVFKKLLGDTVGGIFCTIFSVLFKLISGALKTVYSVAIEVLTAITAFLAKLTQGDFVGAITVLFQKINTAVILAIGGPLADLLGIPFTKEDARRKNMDPAQSFQGLGERLAQKDPLFTVTLAMAIISCVIAAAGLQIRVAIGALVMVLSTAVGIVYAPQLMRLDAFKDMPREKVENGISLVIKLTALVIMAVMTIMDFVTKIKTSVTKWVENMKARTARAGGVAAYLKQQGQGIWDTLTTKVSEAWSALKTWPTKFQTVGDRISEIVKVLPLMLLAVVDDGDGNLTALTQQAQAGFTQAAKDWQTAKTTFDESTKNLTPAEKLKASGAEPLIRTKDDEINELKGKLAETTLKLRNTERNLNAELQRNRTLVASLTKTEPGGPVVGPGEGVRAKRTNAAAPLALAAGGFFVGGPVGAAIGLAVGLAAGGKNRTVSTRAAVTPYMAMAR